MCFPFNQNRFDSRYYSSISAINLAVYYYSYSNLNMSNIPSTMFAEHNTTSFLSDGTNTEAANSAAMLKE